MSTQEQLIRDTYAQVQAYVVKQASFEGVTPYKVLGGEGFRHPDGLSEQESLAAAVVDVRKALSKPQAAMRLLGIRGDERIGLEKLGILNTGGIDFEKLESAHLELEIQQGRDDGSDQRGAMRM